MARTGLHAIAASTALLLVGCAGASDQPESLESQLGLKRYSLGLAVSEIQDYRLTGWNAVDERHLIIHTGPSESYLVSLTVKCRNLLTAEDIGLSTTTGKLTLFDKVIVRSRPAGFTEQCPIESIHALERLPAPVNDDS